MDHERGIFAACALAIVLMFTLPGKEEVAQEAKPTMPEVAMDAGQAETLVKANCISCHGDQLQGGVGPALANIGSKDDVEKIYSTIVKAKAVCLRSKADCRMRKSPTLRCGWPKEINVSA